VIAVAVRWYLRYGLSYRDVEELLAERGIDVDHVTIYRWVQTFTPEFIEAARATHEKKGPTAPPPPTRTAPSAVGQRLTTRPTVAAEEFQRARRPAKPGSTGSCLIGRS
jgi:hypothetical protein